jgi:ankyrin repeat protein
MSIPGLNPSTPPAQDPPPVPPQIPPQVVPPRPGSPTLRNRPAKQGDVGQEDASSARGLKRGLPETEEAGMDIEPSPASESKRRRIDAGPATPERLQALIEAGDEAGLRALLQQAPELLNKFHPPPILQGLTPLCYAAKNGLEAMARCLIDCNASVEVASKGGSPLMFACGKGHLKIARMLRERGAVLTAKNTKGANCLHVAAHEGRDAVVEWLLSEKVSVDEPDNAGCTSLMHACRNGHLKVAQMLHERGASLTSKMLEGWNCLQFAADQGREELVSWLLSQGLGVNEPNKAGVTPLMLACRHGDLRVVQLLHSNGASLTAKSPSGEKCLQFAVNFGREEVVRWLLSQGLDVNEPNKAGVTPLMLACRHGDLRVVQLLHSNGASLSSKAPSGENCLHFASGMGRGEVVKRLLSMKVPVDEPNNEIVTPLMYACRSGHLKVVQMLHERGASLTSKVRDGLSCLHFAADQGREELVSWLLDQGLGVNETTENGRTPLMMACVNGHLKLAQMLRTRGASLTSETIDLWNCLDYAAAKGHEEVVKWLLDQGLAVDGPPGRSVTPLIFSLKEKQFAVIRLLIKRGANLHYEMSGKQPIGKWIFKIACDQERYDVLASLIERDLAFFADLDTMPPEGSSETVDPIKIRARSAAIHDLNRVFQGMELQADLTPEDQLDQVDQLLDPAWLSPEKKSDRQQFIDYYQTQFFLTDSNASNESISKTALSSHPLFSYTIHDHLKPQQGEFSNLLQALAGRGKPINPSHKKKILWFKLEALKTAQITQQFQKKNLLSTTENIIFSVLTRQLDALRLAAEEYFFDEQANFSEVLTELCKKHIRIDGRFDATAFNKALIKQGIYAVNADRLTALVSAAFEVVLRRPLDLPSTATVGRAFDLNAPQVMENLFAELKKSLTYLAKAHEIEGLELVDSEEQDSYPGLSAALKKPLNDLPDALVLPGFADGLAGLEQKDQDIYADQIFGQWRQLSAALGVVLPGPFTARQ